MATLHNNVVPASGAGDTITRGVATTFISDTADLDYITLQTPSNATSFGTLSVGGEAGTAASDKTRGLFFSGFNYDNGRYHRTIEYITIATTGNGTDFGDLAKGKGHGGACSNTVRAVVAGGSDWDGSAYSTNADIEYVTVATTSNSSSFGNLSRAGEEIGGAADATRGLFWMGSGIANIEYITISTTGNASNFGTTIKNGWGSACADATRSVGKMENKDQLEYVTIQTTGNSIAFGDLTASRYLDDAFASDIVGVWFGGYGAGTNALMDTIDYVTIQTLGNATDFGNLSRGAGGVFGCSGS